MQTSSPPKGTWEKSAMWRRYGGLITCMDKIFENRAEILMVLARLHKKHQSRFISVF